MKTPAAAHSWKRRCANYWNRGLCPVARSIVAPGSKDEEDGIHGPAILDAWSVAAQRVWLPGWEQRLDALPQCVGDTPITPQVLRIAMHGSGSPGSEVFAPPDIRKLAYWDRFLAGFN
jgi:hypothetical protein